MTVGPHLWKFSGLLPHTRMRCFPEDLSAQYDKTRAAEKAQTPAYKVSVGQVSVRAEQSMRDTRGAYNSQ